MCEGPRGPTLAASLLHPQLCSLWLSFTVLGGLITSSSHSQRRSHRWSCGLTFHVTPLRLTNNCLVNENCQNSIVSSCISVGNLPQKEAFLLPATLLLYRKIYFCLEWSWWTNLAYSNKCLETVPRQHSPCICHNGSVGGPGFYSRICLHTLCILCISPFCLRKVFLLAKIFQRFYPFFPLLPPSPFFFFVSLFLLIFWDILLICSHTRQILPVCIHGWSVPWPETDFHGLVSTEQNPSPHRCSCSS